MINDSDSHSSLPNHTVELVLRVRHFFFLMFPGNFLVVPIVILGGPVKEFSKKNAARHRAGQKTIKKFTLVNN